LQRSGQSAAIRAETMKEAEFTRSTEFESRPNGSAFSSREEPLIGILASIDEVFVASGGK